MVRIKRGDLVPGKIFELFSKGAKVVILENEDRVASLWKDLFGCGNGVGLESGEILPWEGSLMDIARNNQLKGGPGNDIGDVMFFMQDRGGNIARKFNLSI